MIDLKKIPEDEKTPLVVELLHALQQQKDEIQRLKDEIARLKQLKGKPKIPPSRLEKDTKDEEKKKTSKGKRPGSAKRKKTKDLTIDKTICVPPEDLPAESSFVGYSDWIVQGLKIERHNVCYRLECWRTPDGTVIKGVLPHSVDGHFDAVLQSFILQQHYHGHVTQPLIWEELCDFGIDISTGQVNRILTENKEAFHLEKDGILRAGLDVSSYIHVDDTGARHAGRNGYCTHIGNELFAWFESTGKKSRINFLELLHTGYSDYVINVDALDYMQRHKFPRSLFTLLDTSPSNSFENKEEWKEHLKQLGISNKNHVRIATEAALIASILRHGFFKELVIISDDAGQFNIFLHALCWIHAERIIHKLVACSDAEENAIKDIRDRIWELYRYLKFYKKTPDEEKKAGVEKFFDDLFATETCSPTLNAALRRLAKNKNELLLVLERPDIPLHNNLSERDIREYVKKRKISGGTRSENGRRSRDTFTSLKKTCRKLRISFWEFLYDRVSKTQQIPPLPDIIRARVQ